MKAIWIETVISLFAGQQSKASEKLDGENQLLKSRETKLPAYETTPTHHFPAPRDLRKNLINNKKK